METDSSTALPLPIMNFRHNLLPVFPEEWLRRADARLSKTGVFDSGLAERVRGNTGEEPSPQSPIRRRSMQGPWATTFNRKLRQGHDHGSAAYAADEAEKRAAKACPSTHCGRRQECTSPNDCFSRSAMISDG